ncbi:MAG: hypothetical protein KHY19_02860 [Coprobacillus cateniformis]|nr:hypothetical protein [Coprobacillus cateniformis]
MFNIKNDICKSVILITGICSIYHLSKLAIENNYEPEFHYKDCFFKLSKNNTNNKPL